LGQGLGNRISEGNPSSSQNNKKRKNLNSNGNNGGNNNNNNGNGKKAETMWDDTPIMEWERKFLDTNIGKGGGRFIRESVQNKVEWIKEARERKLCIQCTLSGHFKGECPATNGQNNNSSGTSSSSLNAIFPGTGSLNWSSQS
jgi:hypothetical protein